MTQSDQRYDTIENDHTFFSLKIFPVFAINLNFKKVFI